jgi:hypothetical protein
LNRCDQLIRIVALIGQHGVGLEPFEQRLGLCTVMPFTSGHDESERIAQCIAHGMQFRGKPTPATPYRLRLLPPFAPAACWWARMMVASIMSHAVSASTARVLNLICQPPCVRPPTEPLVDPRPSPVHTGQRAPGRAGAPEPHDGFDNASMIARATHIAGFAGERIFDPLPLILSQLLGIVHENLLGGEILAQCSLNVDRA